MDMSPQRVRSAEFKTIRKGGLDGDAVRAFLADVADELERAQNQATAMEARARAAVARLQEMGEAPAAKAVPVEVSADESETISRTLLLAQRTADATTAEARAEADRLLRAANDEAAATRDSTREMAAQLIEEARVKARQAGEAERVVVAGDVEALRARRDFLESDVEHLELFLVDQRNRVRDAATALLDITERVPGGLGDVRPPLLSAADSATADGAELDAAATDTPEAPGPDDAGELLIQTDIADDESDDEFDDGFDDGAETPRAGISTDGLDVDGDGLDVDDDGDDERDDSDDEPRWDDQRDEPTQAMPVVESARPADESGGFRFSFDDER